MAWFDGLTLEVIDPSQSPAVIIRERLAAGTISPMQYGQFIEYLCNLVPGMWAEKLDDGSFEGLSPYKFAYLKETDFRERPWYPTARPTAPRSSAIGQARSTARPRTRSTVVENVPCTVGIAQDGTGSPSGSGMRLFLLLQVRRHSRADSRAASPRGNGLRDV